MDAKERFIQYLKFKGVGQTAFEAKAGLSRGVLSQKSGLTASSLEKIIISCGDLNSEWLITGKGEMLKTSKDSLATTIVNNKPRIPYTAAAGSITNAVEGISEAQCEQVPVVPTFPSYDFTIIVKGDSMEPKIEGGDEVACKRVDGTSFIQWGKVHVLDTAQGILIKRIYEDGDKIKCVSYNPEYPPFSIDKSEIYSISLVVGLLRI